MTKVKAYTKSDGTPVSGYERGGSKPDPEDGTGFELPHVAPKEGPTMTTVPKAGTPKKPTTRGVTILGGGEAGRMKAPEVKRGK